MVRTRGYKSWIRHNNEVLENGIKKHVNTVIKPDLALRLNNLARQLVDAIDTGAFSIPIYTGNLHDATGVGVYVDGLMTAFMPTKLATQKQASGPSMAGGESRPYIFGSDFLAESLHEATTTFSSGVWLVIFSAVPYAYKINTEGSPKGRGQGYWDAIINDVIAKLKPLTSL